MPKSSDKKVKRPPSPWVKHCQAWAKKYNMKYGDVLSDPDCKKAYHSAKKPKSKK